LEDAFAALHVRQGGRHLFRRQHYGEPFRTPGPHRVEAAKVNLQHLLVQEKQRIESLVLGACRHLPLDRQVGEELLDLGVAHVARMPFVVEEDKAGDPLEVAFLSTPRRVANAQDLAHLVEQAGRPGQRQLPEVPVQHLAIEEVEGIAAGGEGADGVFVGLGEGLQELADLG
jgi:hypothetical protein